MTEEVYNYFVEQYQKAPFVMAGQLPDDFASKEEVDLWIKTWSNSINTVQKYARSGHVDDPACFKRRHFRLTNLWARCRAKILVRKGLRPVSTVGTLSTKY